MNQAQLEMERRIRRLEEAVGIEDEPQEKEAAAEVHEPGGETAEHNRKQLLDLLDRPIDEIEPELRNKTDEQLLDLRQAEEDGKTRDGAIKAIDAEIARRAE